MFFVVEVPPSSHINDWKYVGMDPNEIKAYGNSTVEFQRNGLNHLIKFENSFG